MAFCLVPDTAAFIECTVVSLRVVEGHCEHTPMVASVQLGGFPLLVRG